MIIQTAKENNVSTYSLWDDLLSLSASAENFVHKLQYDRAHMLNIICNVFRRKLKVPKSSLHRFLAQTNVKMTNRNFDRPLPNAVATNPLINGDPLIFLKE